MHDVILDKILDKFSFLTEVFASKPALKNCFLFIFGICFSTTKTITGIADWFGDIDQSTLNRFLTQSKWDNKKLFKVYHNEIQKQSFGKIVKLLIDDSKIQKAGEMIEKVGWEFDHAKKLHILCFSVVFSVVKINGFELPVPFAAEACKKKKKGQKREKSKITIAMKMIADFVKVTEGAAKRIILFDCWYCAKKLIHAIPDDVYWVTRLKFNKSRLVWLNGCWLPIWKFCRGVNSWNFKRVEVHGHYFWVYAEKIVVKGLGEVTVVLSKKFRYSRLCVVFISNLDDAKEILENYEDRWEIEVFFRGIKQNFGIGDVQMRKYLGNRRYWSMVLLAYSSISFLQHLWRKTCKTAGETLAKLRKLLQNAAADYGMNLGRFTHLYVCEKIAKV